MGQFFSHVNIFTHSLKKNNCREPYINCLLLIEEFVLLQMLRGLIPRELWPLWESQQPRTHETIGKVPRGLGKKGGWSTHDWRRKGSRQKNARGQVRWPDSLSGLSGRRRLRQIPFILCGLVFPTVPSTVWPVSSKMWMKLNGLLRHCDK